MVVAGVKEKGNPMDIEERLRKVEVEVRRTKVYVSAVLVIVLLLLALGLLRGGASGEWTIVIIVVLALAVVAHLLVTAGSGLRVFWGRRATDAQLQEKIMREFTAERAKTQNQNHP
jgi:hypothetical protein